GSGRAAASGSLAGGIQGLALESTASVQAQPRHCTETPIVSPSEPRMSLDTRLSREAPITANVDCVVVGAFADATFTPAAQAIDAACGGRLRALAEIGRAHV